MDAKSKVNFINSVAFGASVTCPKCKARNTSDSEFCIYCGTKITAPQTTANSNTAFAPVKGKADSEKTSKYVEPNNVFAQGLPEWDLTPPQVIVRRH